MKFDETEVITLCGSTKFKEEFFETAKKLTLKGKLVFTPFIFNHSDKMGLSKETLEMLDKLHKKRIDLSAGIYVVDVGEYIGDSTREEIKYAQKKGKRVDYYSKEVKDNES